MKKVKKPKPNPIVRLLSELGDKINLVSRLKTIDDREVLYTDFTEVIYKKRQAKTQLMPIIDHGSKVAFGHALVSSSDTDLALKAWNKAKPGVKNISIEQG